MSGAGGFSMVIGGIVLSGIFYFFIPQLLLWGLGIAALGMFAIFAGDI